MLQPQHSFASDRSTQDLESARQQKIRTGVARVLSNIESGEFQNTVTVRIPVAIALSATTAKGEGRGGCAPAHNAQLWRGAGCAAQYRL